MIHFAYRVPPTSNVIFARSDEILLRAERVFGRLMPLSWRKKLTPDPSYVLRSPFSITVHLYPFLSSRMPTRLYDMHERGHFSYDAGDLILGHPSPRDPNTVIRNAMLSNKPSQLKALIFPIHHAIPEYNHYAFPLVERADLVFGIMGRYWYDTLEQSEFAGWKPKIVRLDMAIDSNIFPHLKRKFNEPGKRGYLYIGRNGPEKGIDVLSRTMAGLTQYPRAWVGNGEEIPNMERESSFRILTPEYMKHLASKYDFFVNTSVSDANPTTILEAMAWGFPTACTPQSGYYQMPSIITLSSTDIEQNVEKLRTLQFAPESQLREISRTNRRLVETEYTWDRFCSLLWQNIKPFCT